ncbi:hypothetical protein ACOMHN_042294 [Nucella lapillus]
MDDIETTYVNMLGSETLENHVPAINRKWLKERILTDLPHLKSIRQKDRRKSAVIYSPEACDEEMIHDAMTADDDEKKHEDNLQSSTGDQEEHCNLQETRSGNQYHTGIERHS